MFMLETEANLNALKLFEPAIYAASEKARQRAVSDLDFKRVDNDAFRESPSLSIDYAVMECIENLRVIPYQGDCSDVGSWDSVASLANQDEAGNTIQGDAVLVADANKTQNVKISSIH